METAQDCVKVIYTLLCLVVANLLFLIALSAISASIEVTDFYWIEAVSAEFES